MNPFLILVSVAVFWIALPGTGACANPGAVEEKSPDGKWRFTASWLGDLGYTWELINAKSGKAYFSHPHPAPDEGLPARVNTLWSPDSRYLEINFYYGRIAYDIGVISLAGDVPPTFVRWPAATEQSMIKAQDRKSWDGDGVVCCSASNWGTGDTLQVGYVMWANLTDKASGKKIRIYSSREATIQFSGLAGKIVQETPPDY